MSQSATQEVFSKFATALYTRIITKAKMPRWPNISSRKEGVGKELKSSRYMCTH